MDSGGSSGGSCYCREEGEEGTEGWREAERRGPGASKGE